MSSEIKEILRVTHTLQFVLPRYLANSLLQDLV
jgi:hypothetical protein